MCLSELDSKRKNQVFSFKTALQVVGLPDRILLGCSLPRADLAHISHGYLFGAAFSFSEDSTEE